MLIWNYRTEIIPSSFSSDGDGMLESVNVHETLLLALLTKILSVLLTKHLYLVPMNGSRAVLSRLTEKRVASVSCTAHFWSDYADNACFYIKYEC